ncbi:MAG: hypothetical protein Q4B29_02940 [Candidatus Saccharibacteria bacterium]|nr:hypothetical protein [Candidatus Saccharibacteria bacterium]
MCQKNNSEVVIPIPPYIDPELIEVWVEILGAPVVLEKLEAFFEFTGIEPIEEKTFVNLDDDDFCEECGKPKNECECICEGCSKPKSECECETGCECEGCSCGCEEDPEEVVCDLDTCAEFSVGNQLVGALGANIDAFLNALANMVNTVSDYNDFYDDLEDEDELDGPCAECD